MIRNTGWTVLAVLCSALAVAAGNSELSGTVFWSNGSPAQAVVVGIGGYSVTTGSDGEYSFSLDPGEYVVAVSPPGGATRSFSVRVDPGSTRRDFTIDW